MNVHQDVQDGKRIGTAKANGKAKAPAVPADLVRFVDVLFKARDCVLIRPIETYIEDGKKKSQVIYDQILYLEPKDLTFPSTWERMLRVSQEHKANLFFGVCPRFKGGKFDLAWQIRTVRALWLDIDHCSADEALQRVEAAGLPRPTIVVSSGNGVHLYWVLAEPFLIDDAGDPLPVQKEFLYQGEGKKKKPRQYILDPQTKTKVYDLPELSAKGLHVQKIIAGMAAKLGGDHTQDISRLLRLPCTFNRKDERNGKPPVPCELVDCEPERRFALADFEKFADAAPAKVKAKEAARVRLPSGARMTPKRQRDLSDLLNVCAVADDRSKADYSLCCWVLRNGIDKEVIWAEACHVGKFQECGRDYFDRTWAAAEDEVRVDIHDRACRRAAKSGAGFSHDCGDGQAESDSKSEHHLTDLGNAKRVLDRHGERVRYCHPWKRFLIWDDRRWLEDDTAEAVRLVTGTQQDLYKDISRALMLAQHASNEEKEYLSKLLAHLLKWEDRKKIEATVELMKAERGVPILPEQLNRDPYLFNVMNGTIDLRTGDLRQHQQSDYITKISPVQFLPELRDEDCSLWLCFLERVMAGNAGVIDYLRRVIGYSLTGDVGEQSLWFLHGSGANGKSTFLGAIRELMGDYGWQAVSELLIQRSHETHPTERADLFGKRFVCTIETEQGKRIAEALMKQMTGGDKMTARKMRQDFFEFSPTHKLFLAANHKPTIRGTDYAVWRRIKLVPFTVTIPEEEKDKALPAKLKAELPAILAWAVRGCLEWQREGMREPGEVTDATNAYRAEQDKVAKFLGECCLLSSDGNVRIRSSALLDAFQEWSGERITGNAFSARLEEMGHTKDKGGDGCMYWIGIGLTP
jgi:putative DNA primase/helicase